MVHFQPCPNIASLTAQYAIWDADIAENVFHVGTNSAWTSDLLTELANVYIAWETTTVAGVRPVAFRTNVATLQQVICRDLTTRTSPEVTIAPAGGPIAGIDTGKALPNGMTVALKHLTGTPGRSFRGRTYWIGLTASWQQTDPNFLVSSVGAGLVQLLVNLSNAIHGHNSDWKMVVLSRNLDNAERVTGIGTAIAGFGLTNGALDYQRRRAPFHSRHH